MVEEPKKIDEFWNKDMINETKSWKRGKFKF